MDLDKYIVKYFDTHKSESVKVSFRNLSNALTFLKSASKKGFVANLTDTSTIL